MNGSDKMVIRNPMSRTDYSTELYHLIRGETPKEAFETLKQIQESRAILGSNHLIKGGYFCVCFSESPRRSLVEWFKHERRLGPKYQPFGFTVKKEWFFEQGGRPVIYQPDEEYHQLPDTHRWRHVRYNPMSNPPIDFTWEREWRLQTDSLSICPKNAKIVVFNQDYYKGLLEQHEREQHIHFQWNTIIFDEIIAWQREEDFEWNVVTLGEE